MKNKYLEAALKKTVDAEVIEKSAKAHGIYVQGDRLQTFSDGFITGAYCVLRFLGMKEESIKKIINEAWGDNENGVH